jgi:hypothetical protein
MRAQPTVQSDPSSASARASRESAFGVVEVLIAVLLIIAVTSAVVLAMDSSSRLRGSARLQSAMTHTGQRMIEKLADENEWMKTCAPPRCAIAQAFDADSRKLEDAEGSVQVIGALSGTPAVAESHAVPVDSKVDGLGAADQDGVTPDHYQVLLVIRPDASTIARYGGNAAMLTRKFTTAMDRNGKILKGSLRVDACLVRTQVDERMSIDGCNASGPTSIHMEGCPVDPPPGGAFARCNPAWNWVASSTPATPWSNPSGYVSLERVPPNRYNFTIENLSTGGSPISSSSATVVDGGYVFKNIESGTYRINGLPATMLAGGISHPRWKTKEIPTYHDAPGGSVSVQPGVKNYALVMFRPPKTNSGIKFYFDRRVHNYQLVSDVSVEKTPKNGAISLAGEQWAPTNDYEGDGASTWCDEQTDKAGAYTHVVEGGTDNDADINATSVTLATDDYKSTYYRQCWIYKSDYATDNTAANCHVASYRAYFYDYDKDLREEGAVQTGTLGPFERTQTWCTWFRDEYKHKYWHANQKPDTIKKGAVKTAVYEVSPRPTTREINFGPGESLVGATYPRNFCKVRGHTTNQPSLDQWECGNGSTIDKLHPGLHTDVFYPSDATVSTNGSSESNPSNAVKNQTEIAMPAWAKGGGLWVRPNGSIVGSPGGGQATVGTNPTIHLRGDGECYWVGGLYLPSPWEGSCGQCNITWKKTVKYTGECAMLERTCITRFVAETTVETPGWNTPSLNGQALSGPIKSSPVPIQGGSGNCRTYNPEWICNNIPPTIIGGGNCRTPPTGPPGGSFNLSPTSHQVSQGVAHVDQRPATSAPGTL